jgi:outer membrane protein OmpA-like peptidoglycan-associated protein
MENRRVEIHSDSPEIMSPVESTYMEKIASAETIRLIPEIRAEAGIKNWTINLYGDDDIAVKSIGGKGEPDDIYAIRMEPADMDKISGLERLVAGLTVEDNAGEVYRDMEASSLTVRYIRKERLDAKKAGQKIHEKYALILFDFDSAEIDGRNEDILKGIARRIRILPNPRVEIVGHTDTIGTERYNKNLSEKRARNACESIASHIGKNTGIFCSGVGEKEPIFDNDSPAGRMLNRTVAITLIYEANNQDQ